MVRTPHPALQEVGACLSYLDGQAKGAGTMSFSGVNRGSVSPH